MSDVDALKAQASITTLIQADLGPAAAKSGRWLLWRCPFHADTDPSLAVTADTGTWHCFGCGKSGDAITWLQERERLSFREACERLEVMGLPDCSVAIQPPSSTPNDGSPSPEWQERAKGLVETCKAALWTDQGEKARTWLTSRGLREETLKIWRLGYNPADRKIHGLWVSRGVVMPCFAEGALWYVKVRRSVPPLPGPKYQNVAGSKSALFGAHNLEGHDMAVLTESEFDAMLLDQEAGDLVGVASLGGAGKRLDTRWIMYLLDKRRVLAAYDTDKAGLVGAGRLLAQSKRVRTIRPPKGNDITDYWKAGGCPREWVEFHLAKLKHGGASQVKQSSPDSPGESLRDRLEATWRQVAPGSPHAVDPHYVARFLELLHEYEQAEERNLC